MDEPVHCRAASDVDEEVLHNETFQLFFSGKLQFSFCGSFIYDHMSVHLEDERMNNL